jgi:heme exporter protein D
VTGFGEFFAMGGYAWYVWGSYGVCFALLALELFFLTKRNQKAKASETTA